MSKLEQAKQSARELKNAVAVFEVTNAAAPAPAGGRQFTVNGKPHSDVLANYERV